MVRVKHVYNAIMLVYVKKNERKHLENELSNLFFKYAQTGYSEKPSADRKYHNLATVDTSVRVGQFWMFEVALPRILDDINK